MGDAVNHKISEDKKAKDVGVFQGRSSKLDEEDQIPFHGSALSEKALQRQRKLVFLEICICEYIVRSHVHYKVKSFYSKSMLTVAIKLTYMLEIESFFPDMELIDAMLMKFTKGVVPVKTRKIPASLDLRDIVAYCGNHGQIAVLEKDPESSGNDVVVIEIINDNTPPVFKFGEAPEPSTTSKPNKKRPIKECTVEPEMSAILSNKDALRRLKPLKKFALAEENHPAFKLLTQLDKIFAKPGKNDK
ncbi:uncharacterized protein [Drosophila bipectinata]|uniref:uncharacterized protein n=1 Tax=Drosophila bipectinata TaxID=42026 RepID=UPI0038B2E34F